MPTTPPIAPSDITALDQATASTKAKPKVTTFEVDYGEVAEGASTTNKTQSFNYGYVMFPIPALPAGATVTSATLTLTVQKLWDESLKTITLAAITQNWSSSNLKWSSRPSVRTSDMITTTFTDGAVKAVIVNDVTPHIVLATTGTSWYGWRIGTTGIASQTLYGKGTYEPKLTITYSVGPTKATSLRPGVPNASDNAYIDLAKPTLVMEGTAHSPGQSTDTVQVQISNTSTVNASGAFPSPVWDSGEVPSTLNQLDLSLIPASPSAAADVTYWWTGRYRDSIGRWSPWAVPEKYTRKTHGTLVINNPANAPNNYVEDSTPPISWTLTGRTQVQYQLLIGDPSTGQILYTGPVVAGTETVTNPPAGIITVHNKVYRAIIRTWDTFYSSRQFASNATTVIQPYVETWKDFTYKLTTSVTPVTNFTAVSDPSKPIVDLAWNRTLTPDGFEIVRDGEILATNLTVDDVNQVGTSYSWSDYFPPPLVTHTYEVRAIVNGQTSATNPTATAINSSSLAWLADIENDIWIAISGEAPVETNLTEVGANFSIQGAKYDVHITSALLGYSGTVTGGLCGECIGDGTTSQDLQDQLLEIRDRPGTRLHLAIANIAVPVVAYNISTFPRFGAQYGQIFGVKFDFHQVA